MEAAADGQRLGYLLHVPPAEAAPADGWPLLLFLHGIGESGDDLERVRVHGPPKLTEEIPELSRFVLLAPQCPEDDWWRSTSLKALLDEVAGLVDVDDARIYVTGLSMGGYGAWGLLASYPDLFAAAAPICGGGEIGRVWSDRSTGFQLERLLLARDVPVRAFHGADDDVIPVEESRLLVRALQAAGADVELTVYPGVGHDSWTQTYEKPELYTWLLAQSRDAR